MAEYLKYKESDEECEVMMPVLKLNELVSSLQPIADCQWQGW